MFCPNCGQKTDETKSGSCESCHKPLGEGSYAPPEGYAYDLNSGLYYQSKQGFDSETGAPVRRVAWFDPNSGEYQIASYPLDPAPQCPDSGAPPLAPPPQGFKLHADSGLYYRAAKSNGSWTLTWFDPATGSTTTEQYGKGAGADKPKKRGRRVAVVVALFLVVMVLVVGSVFNTIQAILDGIPTTTVSEPDASAPNISKPDTSAPDSTPATSSQSQADKADADAPLTEQKVDEMNMKWNAIAQGGLIAMQGDWIFYADPASGGLLCALNQADDSEPIVLTDYPVANINVLEDKLVFTDMVGSYLVRNEGNQAVAWMLPSDLQNMLTYELLYAGDDQVVFGGELYEATGLQDFLRSGNVDKLTITPQEQEKGVYYYFVCADANDVLRLKQRFFRLPPAAGKMSQKQAATIDKLGTVQTVSNPVTKTNSYGMDANLAQKIVTDDLLLGMGAVSNRATQSSDCAVTHTVFHTLKFGEYKEYEVRESLDRGQFAIRDRYTEETVIVKGHNVQYSAGGISFIDNETGYLMQFADDRVIPLSTVAIKDYEGNADGFTVYYDDGNGKERAGLLSTKNLDQAHKDAGVPVPGHEMTNGYRFYPAPPSTVLGPEHGNLSKYTEQNPRTDALFRTDAPDGSQYIIMNDENGKNRWMKLQRAGGGWTIVADLSERMKISHYDLYKAERRLQELINRAVGRWKENDLDSMGVKLEGNPALQAYLQKYFGWEGLVRGTDDELKELKRDGGSEISLEVTEEKFDMVSGVWLSTVMHNGLPSYNLRLSAPDDSTIGFRRGEEMYGETAYFKCDARFDGVFLDLKVYENAAGNAQLNTGGSVSVGTMFYFRLEPDSRTLTYVGDTLDGMETGTQFR